MEFFTENLTALQAIGVFIIGFSPTIFNYISDKMKWKTEETFIQTEAMENIVQAASILVESSKTAMEKDKELMEIYEMALKRQEVMTEEQRKRADGERDLRIYYENEIEVVKRQITELNDTVVTCATRILSMVRDINDGIHISKEKLDELEKNWQSTE